MTLAARSLSFGYPGRVIGRGLDLELAPGEVVCVLGPNGAGKTTLFRTLLGLIAPLGGEALVAGAPVGSLSRAHVARAVAYVPQASSAAFDFTLLDVAEMGRAAHLGPFAQPARRDREAAVAALQRLGIASLGERALNAVSGGERQLALIARALASEAPAMVMDEPTASLDFGNQARVMGEIARLRDAGIAILLCSHDPNHASRVADRTLLLQGGRILAEGPTRQVLTAENLSRLYGVAVRVGADGVIASAGQAFH